MPVHSISRLLEAKIRSQLCEAPKGRPQQLAPDPFSRAMTFVRIKATPTAFMAMGYCLWRYCRASSPLSWFCGFWRGSIGSNPSGFHRRFTPCSGVQPLPDWSRLPRSTALISLPTQTQMDAFFKQAIIAELPLQLDPELIAICI